jgi:hypothetical protein
MGRVEVLFGSIPVISWVFMVGIKALIEGLVHLSVPKLPRESASLIWTPSGVHRTCLVAVRSPSYLYCLRQEPILLVLNSSRVHLNYFDSANNSSYLYGHLVRSSSYLYWFCQESILLLVIQSGVHLTCIDCVRSPYLFDAIKSPSELFSRSWETILLVLTKSGVHLTCRDFVKSLKTPPRAPRF